MGFAAGDPNLYRVVGNDFTNDTDPSGLQDRPKAVMGGGASSPKDTWATVQGLPGSAQWKVNQAIDIFMKWGEARDLFDKTKMALGGKLSIKADTSNDDFNGYAGSDPFKGSVIYINPNANGGRSIDQMVGTILFETLNQSKMAEFDKVSILANKGDLNRIDYVVAYEKIEYDNLKRFAVIANAAVKAKVWDPETAKREITKDFDSDLLDLIKRFPKHIAYYADYWNNNYSKKWDKGHPAPFDPNAPEAEATKQLQPDTIKQLQAFLVNYTPPKNKK
jgi:hypothetical protein